MGKQNSGSEKGRRMTTAQIKSMKQWPSLERVINLAMQHTAAELKLDVTDIELVEETYRWVVRINGRDVMEIDPRDLSEHSNN